MATKKNIKKGGTKSKKPSQSKKKQNIKEKFVGRNAGERLSLLETHRNVVMLVYLCVGVFLGCVAFIHGSNIWEKFRACFFALFGIGFYFLFVYFIVAGIKIALNKTKRSLLMMNLSAGLFITVFSSFVHLFNYTAGDSGMAAWKEQLADATQTGWDMGINSIHWCGGIIGALFGGTALQSCGKAAAFVIIIALLIASILFMFNISVNTVGNLVAGLINKGKDQIDKTGEQTKSRIDENKRIRAERRRLEQEQREAEQRAAEEEASQDEAETITDDGYVPSFVITDDSVDSTDAFDFNDTEIENDPEVPMNKPVRSKATAETLSTGAYSPISGRRVGREYTQYRPEDSVFTYPDNNSARTTGQQTESKPFIADDLISSGKTKKSSVFDQYQEKEDKIEKTEESAIPEGYEEIEDDFIDEHDGEIDVYEDRRAELSTKAKKIVKDAADTAASKRKKSIDDVNNYVDEVKPKKEYMLPPIDCLNEPVFGKDVDFAGEMKVTARKLVDVLKSFGVETKLIGVSIGPSVTRYELSPAPGVKISKITNLSDDIALGLASSGVRIEAPIPNKSAVGIEVPNKSRATVTMREMISSEEYKKGKNNNKLLNVALGKDITGNITCADLSKMPHLLIAGTTGSGKSVCLNVMIASILYNATPSQVKLLMIDPKQVEFTVYNGIPHLLVPVISDARKAAGSLAWAVGEMDSRYKTFSNCAVRDISSYNKYITEHPELNLQYMPQIVIFIDELNDLMMVSPKEVEDSICRLAQKARAAGMHLVVATQRPSVDVITGIIKANIPSRISLSVSSQVDSRTILDTIGAEKLLGNGDMLFNPVGISKPVRIQGAYLSDGEIEKIVSFIKDQENASYDDGIMEEIEKNAVADTKKKSSGSVVSGDDDEQYDALIEDAMGIVTELNSASTTVLQRKLSVGYARAARIMDQLEQLGYISPAEGNKPRKVLVTRAQYLEMKAGADSVSSDDFDVLSD